jgi:hypothetical protein
VGSDRRGVARLAGQARELWEYLGGGVAGFTPVLTASAAVADAIEKERLPQWRARSAASRRVARALGFYELGAQVSIRLGRPAD